MADGDGIPANQGAPDAGGQGGGGGDSLGWRAQLPDDLKANETFTGFKTVGDLAKTHLDLAGKAKELEGKLGDAIPKLKENATEEEVNNYLSALGRPAAPEAYTLPTAPEEFPMSDEAQKWFRHLSFKHGFSQKQAEGFLADYFGLVMKGYEMDQANKVKAVADQIQEMQRDPEWAGDKFDVNVKHVERVLAKFGSEKLTRLFEEAKIDGRHLGNHPDMLRFVWNISKVIGEDTLIRGVPPRSKPEDKEGAVLSYPTMKT